MRNNKIGILTAAFFIYTALAIGQAYAADITRLTFHFSDGDVPATVKPESIRVLFNPKEYTITKATPWKHHDIQGIDAPNLEFTSGKPFRLEMELFFDTYEEKRDVRNLTHKIESLIFRSSESQNQPACLVTWGSTKYKCEIESATTNYTLFLEDGTPVRAVMSTVFKEFSLVKRHSDDGDNLSAEDILDIMEKRYTHSWPGIIDLIGGTRNCIPLFKSYDATSFQEVAETMLQNLQTEKNTYLLSPHASPNTMADTPPEDRSAQVRGFKIEIEQGNGKVHDRAWETVTGGDMIIELTETTVGSDKFHTSSPGHKTVGEITLRGPMTKNRKTISEWIKDTAKTCKKCINASLFYYDDKMQKIAEWNFSAMDYYQFKNEALFITLDNDSLNAIVLNVKRTYSDGTPYAGPPQIFIVLPSSGPAFMPVAIGGINFDKGAIPYFNNIPSISLFNWGTANIPLLGSISVGSTIVPPAAPSGPGDIVIEYLGQRSNPFPFTVN